MNIDAHLLERKARRRRKKQRTQRFLAGDDDPGADLGAAVEIDDIVVGHADAAGRNRLTDGVGLVGAVDAE